MEKRALDRYGQRPGKSGSESGREGEHPGGGVTRYRFCFWLAVAKGIQVSYVVLGLAHKHCFLNIKVGTQECKVSPHLTFNVKVSQQGMSTQRSSDSQRRL